MVLTWLAVRNLLFVLLLVGFGGSLLAQHALWTYSAAPVYKRLTQNPALATPDRAWLSLPLIGHVDQAALVPISLQDGFGLDRSATRTLLQSIDTTALDAVTVNMPAILGRLSALGRIRVRTQVNLLGAGYSIDEATTVFLNIDQNLDAYAAGGPDAFAGLYQGEAYVQRQGVDLSRTRYEALAWTSYALGMQVAPPSQRGALRLGGALKLIRSQAHSGLHNIEATVQEDSRGLGVDIVGRTRWSGFRRLSDESISPLRKVLGGANWGLGADVGLVFASKSGLTWSASLVDVGFVRGKDDPHLYRFENAVRQGDSKPLIEQTTPLTIGDVRAEIDEVGRLGVSGIENRDRYWRSLPTTLYVGADYDINERLATSIVTQWSARGGQLQTAAAVQVRVKPWNFLETGGSVAWTDGAGAGLGFNVAVQAGPVRIYAGSDHVLGLIDFSKARWVHATAGITLVLPEGDDDRGRRGKGLRQNSNRGGKVKCPEW